MTVCIAAICDKNKTLVLASDSMLTNQGLSIQFEHPTRKMTPLSESCIALTAGDALAHTELFNAVLGQVAKLKTPSVDEMVIRIKTCYKNIRQREIEENVLHPRGFGSFKEFYEAQRVLVPDIAMSIQNDIERYDYGLQIVVAGISDGVAHIYGVFDPGTSKCFDAIGFHAIGSGLPHAVNTLIARGINQSTPLAEAVVVVYEAKKMAEKAPGVGSNITDICIMRQNRSVDFPREQIGELDKIHKRWVRRDPGWEEELDKLLKQMGVPEI